jgi:putative ABC transport system ATP-binding protein
MSFFSRSAPVSPAPEPRPADLGLAPGVLVGLSNLEKSYVHGTSRSYVLRRINAEIKEGEFVSIMGPSGAGKSTLLHIIGMHDSAWTGEYYFLDQPVHRLSAKDRARLHKQHIGFVFQSYHLLDHLTVYENLDIPLSYRDIRKSERESMVADILDRFAIVGKKDLYPNQLSGGQQQLVAVARAVISNPKVILADEPTGNLHSSQGKEIMELFRKLNEVGTTIVQVTHSEANAAYGSRVIQLRDGWIVDESGHVVG